MAKGSCKCKAAECEECPEWIFTFADLVMLMMGFFVILWVLKPNPSPNNKDNPDQALPLELLAAIREAFNHLPDPNSKDPVDVYMIMKKLEQLKPHKGEGDGGKTNLEKKAPTGTDPEVEMIRPGKQVGTGAKVLFAAGDATLSPESKIALDQIATIIKGHRQIFVIKGHASSDDLTESDEKARMDLSVKRAQAAADYLFSSGVEYETVRVQGCSTHEPVIQRAYTTDTRAQNRRVEIFSSDKLVKEMQDNAKAIEKRELEKAGTADIRE